MLFVKIQPTLKYIKYKNKSHSDSHLPDIITVNSQFLVENERKQDSIITAAVYASSCLGMACQMIHGLMFSVRYSDW